MLPDELQNKLRIYVADPEPSFGRLVVSRLRGVGIQNALWVKNEETLYTNLEKKYSEPFILLIDHQFMGQELMSLVRQIRTGAICEDPFIIIFCTIANPTTSVVQQISVSGVDEVMIKPYSSKSITDRVNNILQKRKPFVATADYVGPDRRSSSERNSEEQGLSPIDAKQIIVPNPVRLLAQNQFNAKTYYDSLGSTYAGLNKERLRNNMFQIAFNTEVTGLCMGHEQLTDMRLTHFANIKQYCENATELAKTVNTDHDVVGKVSLVLEAHAKLNPDNINKKDFESLYQAAHAAFGVMSQNWDASTLASHVRKSAERYLEKMKHIQKASDKTG